MAFIEIAKKIKETHPSALTIFKSGSFYKVYGKDAYIISNLFGYSLQLISENVYICGFPLKSIYSVVSKLEDKKVNYIIFDPKNDYNVEEKKEFSNLNTYEEELKRAYTINKHKNDINKIVEDLEYFIDKPNFKEIVRKIEDYLDESR